MYVYSTSIDQNFWGLKFVYFVGFEAPMKILSLNIS